LLIEAAVESLDAALAAVDGGAHRIELCTDLANAGTTPAVQLLRDCVSRLSIPVFVLVRPRAGDFVYTDAEHRTMLGQIETAKGAGAQGVVSGELLGDHIAEDRTARLIAAARPLPFTFHRAFDECRDQEKALEVLIRLGVERVLTSGGAPTAIEGVEQIARLVRQSKGRIGILPGGGINATNVRKIHDAGVREAHFSVTHAQKVRQVIEALLAR
jgi:copper homeostasis protein